MSTRIWDIWRRAETGPICPVRKFDLELYWGRIKELVKEYDIKYNPEQVLPTDDSLIDDVYEAAKTLLLDVGILCVDTERIMRITEDEVREAIRGAPNEVVLGEGKDAVTLLPRGLEDSRPPFMFARVNSPVTEEVVSKIYQSYAQEPRVDVLNCQGSLKTFQGIPLKVGSPVEIQAEICNVTWARTAARRAGRPGLPLARGPAASTIANIAASSPEYGYRRCDAGNLIMLLDLKTNYQQLTRALHYMHYGCPRYAQGPAFIGSFSGGPEGSTISTLASFIAEYVLYDIDFGWPRVIHVKYKGLTDRMSMWGTSLATAAANKNANLITIGSPSISYAGPCTEMLLWECAAGTLASVVIGSNPAPGGGRITAHTDYQTGLEARFCGELIDATLGIKRENANGMLNDLLAKYEKQIETNTAPPGKRFQECYNLETLKPSREYLEIYDKVKTELEDMGLEF